MMLKPALLALLGCALSAGASVVAQSVTKSWLDRPLTNWNDPGRPMPVAMPTGETIIEMAKRCDLAVRRRTLGERALADAGWLPYLHVDREIVDRDVEIVGGMTEADGMCRPSDFNVFVFVGGRLAGTLSPLAMTSRVDGAIGAVRLAADDTIAAEFVRFADSDPLCCPSGRVTVRYRIDRKGPQPVVVPVSLQPRR
jgi:hypothetical protein